MMAGKWFILRFILGLALEFNQVTSREEMK